MEEDLDISEQSYRRSLLQQQQQQQQRKGRKRCTKKNAQRNVCKTLFCELKKFYDSKTSFSGEISGFLTINRIIFARNTKFVNRYTRFFKNL